MQYLSHPKHLQCLLSHVWNMLYLKNYGMYINRYFVEENGIQGQSLQIEFLSPLIEKKIKESCNYYEQAKMNGYKANNFRDKLKLIIITDPMCFVF